MTTSTADPTIFSAEIAQRTLDRITDYPDTLDMAHWLDHPSVEPHTDLGYYMKDFAETEQIVESWDVADWQECGTAGCIAGHVVAAYRGLYPEISAERIAESAMCQLKERSSGETIWDAASRLLGLAECHFVVRLETLLFWQVEQEHDADRLELLGMVAEGLSTAQIDAWARHKFG